ncbi:response regulator transcription factor [Kitasatospora aureofaciens]|uniref:response regulator n=1 Tax=Kitasatospora aureofaciens TaxID=1894 RepID=UPI001C450740|nr:response regulator transcription factor [Kitasatospora aureofaciens]MBV6700171.1 response regulator transcription factor [Kitasatospora aureofaciens]
MIRVLIADDQTLLRGSLRLLLDSQSDMTAVGEAADGSQAVELAARELPDVVLMDIRMPELDGLEATRRIVAAHASVRVLVLTTFDLDEYVYGALRAGASGFLLKDTPPAELVAAIRVIAGGEALLAPGITKRLIEEFARMPELGQRRPTAGLTAITGREQEVLELVGRGLSNQEIADRLVLSLATVKTHVGRLLAKLDARDRAQLVIVAYESGLIVPG